MGPKSDQALLSAGSYKIMDANAIVPRSPLHDLVLFTARESSPTKHVSHIMLDNGHVLLFTSLSLTKAH